MRIKQHLLSFISRLLRGLGMGLFYTGAGFSIWFYFMSDLSSRYTWGAVSLFFLVMGYVIYWYALNRIFNDAENWH
jgi:hypothetical protein